MAQAFKLSVSGRVIRDQWGRTVATIKTRPGVFRVGYCRGNVHHYLRNGAKGFAIGDVVSHVQNLLNAEATQ